jgi:hypothetical protein
VVLVWIVDAELDAFIRKKQIAIAAIQETFLTTTSSAPNFPDYSIVRKDRPYGRGGGLTFLVHHSIPFTPVDTSFLQDGHTEVLVIKATINHSDLTMFNVSRIIMPKVISA